METGRLKQLQQNPERPLHPFLQPVDGHTPIAFAHRGYSASHPENTMAAFGAAVDLGMHYLETDAQLTADGVLVAFHDRELDRLTGTAGILSETGWPELAGLMVGGTEPIPRLEDVFAEWPDLRINIDAKHDEAVLPLLELVAGFDAWDRVCAGSFSGRRIKSMRDAAGPRLCTSMGPMEVARLRGASFGLPAGRFQANCVQVPITHRGIRVVDAALVRAAHERNLPVHVWTVNDAGEIDRLLSLGVDGIMSDDAELAIAGCRRRSSRWHAGLHTHS